MKLIAEQVKYLRERKNQLKEETSKLRDYFSERENTDFDQIGRVYGDYEDNINYTNAIKELEQIKYDLKNSEFIFKPRIDIIDVGTPFTVKFDGKDELRDFILVDYNTPRSSSVLASLNSDLGKAVQGKTVGDKLSYKVQSTGKELSLSIESINNISSNYEHFIRQRPYSNRTSPVAQKELAELKKNNIDEYNRRSFITLSQLDLALEELDKIRDDNSSQSIIQRRAVLNRIIKLPIYEKYGSDDIDISSHVKLALFEDDKIVEKEFEYINSAVSTELESHYVERISPFGRIIYGLHAGDKFHLLKKHSKGIDGIILSVNNHTDDKQRVI